MKFKLMLYSLCAVIIATTIFAVYNKNNSSIIKHGKAIEFIEQDWDKTLTTSKEKHKLVFVDLFATWCGPCRMLKRNTFTNDAVADFFNTNFVNAAIDVDKGVGVQLSETYGVQVLPTLIVTDETGKVVLTTTGYMNATELLKFGKEALARYNKIKGN